jgi:hypothetical protein
LASATEVVPLISSVELSHLMFSLKSLDAFNEQMSPQKRLMLSDPPLTKHHDQQLHQHNSTSTLHGFNDHRDIKSICGKTPFLSYVASFRPAHVSDKPRAKNNVEILSRRLLLACHTICDKSVTPVCGHAPFYYRLSAGNSMVLFAVWAELQYHKLVPGFQVRG